MRQIGLKMDEQLVSLFKVFFVVIFTVTVAQTQRLETIPSSVVLKAGESTSLLCRYGKPVSYCLINLPGESKPLVLSDKWASPTAGYNYFGEGLDAGQCGVTIDRIRDQNHGNMTCQVLSDGNQFEGHIDIIVARPPLPPELDFIEPNDRRTTFEVDEQIRIKCVSRDGRPGANLTWYLEDEPVPSGVGYPETIETVVGNTTLLTVTLEITRQIQATDDGKSLICRASHLADNRGPRETRMQLSVRYRPQPQPEIGIYGLTLDRTAIINVTIVSNPRPQTEWIIDGVSIPQGTQNGRYESYEPISLRNGAYNVSLSIAGLTLEDTTKIYHLKASNEFGVQEYRVRISSLDTPPSNGLELGAIVGISVVAIIVLVAIVLLVFAKVTRRWCFGERSPPPPASETSDTESADVKATRDIQPQKKRSLPMFQAIFKKRSEKSKGQLGESAHPRNEDEQRLAPSANDTNNHVREGEDDGSLKEEKQLVYAELVFKSGEEVKKQPPVSTPPPQKSSTEYAEIVYVQKPKKDSAATEPIPNKENDIKK